MPARVSVQTLLATDSELASIGVTSVYAANTVDTPTDRLFLVVKWEDSPVAFKTTGPDRFSVWVHDREHDYDRITKALQRVKDILVAAVHVPGSDGWVLSQADWQGEGPDLYDGGYDTRTRYADFQAATRYAPS